MPRERVSIDVNLFWYIERLKFKIRQRTRGNMRRKYRFCSAYVRSHVSYFSVRREKSMLRTLHRHRRRRRRHRCRIVAYGNRLKIDEKREKGSVIDEREEKNAFHESRVDDR